MKYRLAVTDHHNRQTRAWRTPGVYRVPDDIEEFEAAIIIKHGKGYKLDDPPIVRPMPIKTPAPENKVLTAPPVDAEKKTNTDGQTGEVTSASSRRVGRPKKRKA